MPGRTVNGLGGSSRKRARRDPDDAAQDEDDIVDVREASSSLRNDSVCTLPQTMVFSRLLICLPTNYSHSSANEHVSPKLGLAKM